MTNLDGRLLRVDRGYSENGFFTDGSNRVLCTYTFDDCGERRIKVVLPVIPAVSFVTCVEERYYLIIDGRDELFLCEKNG